MPAPTIPVTNNADPDLVNFPKSAIANGQTAGHSKALAKPNRGIIKIDTLSGRNKINKLKITPSIVDKNKTCVWLMYLGMRNIPAK